MNRPMKVEAVFLWAKYLRELLRFEKPNSYSTRNDSQPQSCSAPFYQVNTYPNNAMRTGHDFMAYRLRTQLEYFT